MLLLNFVNLIMRRKRNPSENFYQDSEGIKYKFPERTCSSCKRYPCIEGQERLKCDMAKYGCRKYKE